MWIVDTLYIVDCTCSSLVWGFNVKKLQSSKSVTNLLKSLSIPLGNTAIFILHAFNNLDPSVRRLLSSPADLSWAELSWVEFKSSRVWVSVWVWKESMRKWGKWGKWRKGRENRKKKLSARQGLNWTGLTAFYIYKMTISFGSLHFMWNSLILFFLLFSLSFYSFHIVCVFLYVQRPMSRLQTPAGYLWFWLGF